MTDAGVSLGVRDLSKNWGTVEVLSKVNFDIEPGGFQPIPARMRDGHSAFRPLRIEALQRIAEFPRARPAACRPGSMSSVI